MTSKDEFSDAITELLKSKDASPELKKFVYTLANYWRQKTREDGELLGVIIDRVITLGVELHGTSESDDQARERRERIIRLLDRYDADLLMDKIERSFKDQD